MKDLVSRRIGSLYLAVALSSLVVSSEAAAGRPYETLSFSSEDGVTIKADVYAPKEATALIILYHQAGWSRGEYREIAPKLAALGYRVMAVDARSGNAVNGVLNEAAKSAKARSLSRSYLDAYADLNAALGFAEKRFRPQRIIVWGSSYSASLVFRLAAEHPREVSALVAFSPGEYFRKQKGGSYVEGFAKRVRCPVFVTSSRSERDQAKAIFDEVPGTQKVLFTPQDKGRHGSSALWANSPDSAAYWSALTRFLDEYAPAGQSRRSAP